MVYVRYVSATARTVLAAGTLRRPEAEVEQHKLPRPAERSHEERGHGSVRAQHNAKAASLRPRQRQVLAKPNVAEGQRRVQHRNLVQSLRELRQRAVEGHRAETHRRGAEERKVEATLGPRVQQRAHQTHNGHRKRRQRVEAFSHIC